MVRTAQCCAATTACHLGSPVLAQEADVQAIVDGQFALGGNHPKVARERGLKFGRRCMPSR